MLHLTNMADTASVKKLKVAELREALTERGLNSKGNKQELVDRLTESIEDGGGEIPNAAEVENRAPTDDAITTEEASLLDQELEGIETTADEDAALLAPEPKDDETIEEEKKIEDIGPPTLTPITEPQADTEKVSVEAPKSLTEEDRKRKRAERFSGSKSSSTTEDAKKAARAQRFGVTAPTEPKSGGVVLSMPKGDSAADVDKLKKRAARFGAVVSPVVEKSEQQARLLKRKERFGISTTTAVVTSTGNPELDAKKKKRAERFGI